MPKQPKYMDIYLHLCSNSGPTTDFICHVLKQNDVMQFKYCNYWITHQENGIIIFWQHYAEIDHYLSVFRLDITRKVQKATHILPCILYLQQFHLTKIQRSIRKTSTYPSAVCISVVDQVSLKKL